MSSCATTRIHFNHKVPPIFKIENNKNVSVENVRGKYAEQIKRIVEETLMEEGITVLDSNYLLTRMRRNPTGTKPIPQLDLVVSGNVQLYDFSIIHTRSPIKCPDGKDGDQETYKSIGEIKANLRFTDAHSGKLIHLAEVKGDAFETKSFNSCDDFGFYRQEMSSKIMDEAEKSFKKDLLNHISYGTIPLSVKVFKVDEGLLPELRAGNKLFANDKLEAAAKMYNKAVEKSKKENMDAKIRAHALFSYGIVMGYLGNEEAFEIIDSAYRLNPEPEYLEGKSEMSVFFRSSDQKS